MQSQQWKEIYVKQIALTEAIPYELLLDADPSRSAIEKYLSFSEIHIAVLKGKTIGVLVLFPLDIHTLEIKNIAVAEKFQGKGIGKILLNTATRIAMNRGLTSITIGTSNASVAQLSLYQKKGFEISGIKLNFFTDNYPEALFENDIQCKHMIMLEKKL